MVIREVVMTSATVSFGTHRSIGEGSRVLTCMVQLFVITIIIIVAQRATFVGLVLLVRFLWVVLIFTSKAMRLLS